MVKEIGEGWIGESALGLAIYAFKNGKSFEHTVVIATNHRGDSDSTASLDAQLYCSFKEVNNEDLLIYEKLDLKEIIDKSLKEINLINDFEKLENKKIHDEKTTIKDKVKSLFKK